MKTKDLSKDLSLGIDTSNYKTSVAVVNSKGEILFNSQEFLEVKKGERGLRQSEALFQHVSRIAGPIGQALSQEEIRKNIGCVSASSRPRPIEGSYMPVFLAGVSAGKTVSASLGVPFYEFSHQEGHIEAIRFYSEIRDVDPVICFHFSGGTTEALYIDRRKNRFEIVGGSKDLAYGQVLDRVGVALGLDFPCGEALDNIAMSSVGHRDILSPIKVKDGYVNLSGIETQAQKMITQFANTELADNLFYRLSQSIMEMTLQLSYKYDINNFIYAGGVSCSRYMRHFLTEHLCKDLNITFGKAEMSSDNAIGMALLGGKNIWR